MAGVISSAAGQSGQRSGLDLVDQFSRGSFGGDEVIPAASAHAVGKFQQAVGDGVAAAKIVEEPAIEFGGAQVFLDFCDVNAHVGSARLRLLQLAIVALDV